MNNKLYLAHEFFDYLTTYGIKDLDFVLDFNGIKTINEWLQYTINTLIELNKDLISIDPNDDAIESNDETIVLLTLLLA